MKEEEEHSHRAIWASAGNAEQDLSAPSVGRHREDSSQASISPAGTGLLRDTALPNRRDLEALYLRYRQELLGYLVHKYRLDEHTAEDVIEDTFLRYWERSPNLRIKGNIRSYLTSVARSVVADRYARQRTVEGNLSLDIQSPDPSPHTAMEQAEIAQQIAQAVDSLAESHRLAMELSEAGLSYKQIASTSKCTEKAARRRKEKAWEQLRLRLSQCGPSCVLGTPRQGQCPARTKDLVCLKYLAFLSLRSRRQEI